MDDIVQQALARWPNVPAIAGWLRLTARGDWLLTGEVPAGVRITHNNMRRFIDRNYAVDERGRWFFQNGPQKVYVSLEYTPWVFSLHPVSDSGWCLLSHTRVATRPTHVMLDEQGQFLFVTPLGVGVMRDTDMESITPFLREHEDGLWTLDVPWTLPTAEQCAQREWRLVPALSLVAQAANDESVAEVSPVATDVSVASGFVQRDEGVATASDVSVMSVENVQRADMPTRFGFDASPQV